MLSWRREVRSLKRRGCPSSSSPRVCRGAWGRRTSASLPFVEIIAATGHEAKQVEEALAALVLPSEGVMVCLGDQPALTSEDFGCRQLVTKNADLVRTFPMPDDHVLLDVPRARGRWLRQVNAGVR